MGSNDPMATLAAQLTGNSMQKPRQKTAYNLWGPENRCFVDPVFNERVKEGNVPAKRHAALRSSIYKELFDELPGDERREWIKHAERQHAEALEKFNQTMKSRPSTEAADRQRFVLKFITSARLLITFAGLLSAWRDSLSPSSIFWPTTADGRFLS